MPAVRTDQEVTFGDGTEWSSEGPNGVAWIRLRVKGEKADCLVDANGGVKEVVFDVPR